ncbi:class I adenylate-forming enzyme family protein [Cupriavidus consociatus]|uniref:class I adenylate-forming enzyme family protein n=1 Tax=Cupriavidus consociatus TaxID=2821357 RepID=UPI001AE681D2|nr:MULTISPECIES: long-chain fatty acid--CoA ligase [unclassified Cupriavidus]MBP0623141.1 long-chain fatty acid--CoA ligase [Cupriavidus sp. LEh25]MDK2659835.1 long-chain fatty acid--CoA ligase [Cupriavidus sp. LEh21]
MYLTQGLHRAAQRAPEKPATIFAGRQRTFRELTGRIARAAAVLHNLGVQPGDRVAILAHNSDVYVELLLGIWWAGAVAVPVNTRWSVSEIVYSLSDCGCEVLFVDDAFVDQVDSIRAGSDALQRIVQIGNGDGAAGLPAYESLLQASEPLTDTRTGGDELAAILYTGGTTGFPKGVMLSHSNFWCGAVSRLAETFSPLNGVALFVSPFFHVSGLFRLVMQIVLGATNVIEPQFRPESVLDAFERYEVTDVVLVPSMVQMLLDHPSFDAGRLRSLQRISHGGAPMPPALLDRAMELLPDVGFCSSYGMTETSGVVSVLGPVKAADRQRLGTALRSVGQAGLGAELRIVDIYDKDLPPGSVGEVVLRGPAVMQGYWNKPTETAAALKDGWLHTGDAAWLDEAGHIHVVDRLKDMVITGGENVYSAEVEAALMAHNAVAACAVIGVPSIQWGESVHAVIVLRPGAVADADELRAHCRTRLAGYKCPKSVDFVPSLPLSAAGKILKNRLRDEYLSRATA